MEAQAIVFNEELVTEFKPTIMYLISRQVKKYNSSDFCWEHDDVYQYCLEYLWNATKIYQPDAGMKFRTFAIFHIKSRLGNLRNKIVRHNAYGTTSMSELDSGWGITGREESASDNANSFVSPRYKTTTMSLKEGVDFMNEFIDTKNVFDNLSPERKLVFSEYYIKGKKINDIILENPELKYYKIRRHIKYLDQVYKILIKGETPCLQ